MVVSPVGIKGVQKERGQYQPKVPLKLSSPTGGTGVRSPLGGRVPCSPDRR